MSNLIKTLPELLVAVDKIKQAIEQHDFGNAHSLLRKAINFEREPYRSIVREADRYFGRQDFGAGLVVLGKIKAQSDA